MPAAVREAVRRLKTERKFDHVIALINAALRHRQGQPWMYEGLGPGHAEAGRPRSEVERARDVGRRVRRRTRPSLLYSAVYLSEIGFQRTGR